MSTTENVKKQKNKLMHNLVVNTHTHIYIGSFDNCKCKKILNVGVNICKINVINILYRVVVNNVYVINELHNIGGWIRQILFWYLVFIVSLSTHERVTDTSKDPHHCSIKSHL